MCCSLRQTRALGGGQSKVVGTVIYKVRPSRRTETLPAGTSSPVLSEQGKKKTRPGEKTRGVFVFFLFLTEDYPFRFQHVLVYPSLFFVSLVLIDVIAVLRYKIEHLRRLAFPSVARIFGRRARPGTNALY